MTFRELMEAVGKMAEKGEHVSVGVECWSNESFKPTITIYSSKYTTFSKATRAEDALVIFGKRALGAEKLRDLGEVPFTTPTDPPERNQEADEIYRPAMPMKPAELPMMATRSESLLAAAMEVPAVGMEPDETSLSQANTGSQDAAEAGPLAEDYPF